MFPGDHPIPSDVLARIRAKLEKRALSDVLRLCRQHAIPPSYFEAEISGVIDGLFESRSFGVILSAYYVYGKLSDHTVTDLLLAMFEAGDYPSFLKQAHRFGFYHEMRTQIESAIEWHRDQGRNDADAWTRKFSDMRAAYEKNA